MPCAVRSQEAIQLSQIHKVLEYVNPAYAFSKNNPSGNIIYRNQWTGVNGAPKTYAFNFHYPFHYYNIGLGATALKEQIGLRNTTRVGINLDVGVRSTEKSFLSMGLQGGIKHHHFNTEEAVAVYYEDELVIENITSPYLSAGMMYFTRKFQAGLSMYLLIPEKDNQDYLENLSLNAHVSYYVRISQLFALKPVILYKQNTWRVNALDVGSFLLYKDVLWVGTSYRLRDAVIVSLDIKLTDKLRLGYSYDIGVKKSYRKVGNTNELRLEFELNHRRSKEYLTLHSEITN